MLLILFLLAFKLSAADYDKNATYDKQGTSVCYNGKTYKNKWWTKGDTPGDASGPWEKTSDTCSSSSSTSSKSNDSSKSDNSSKEIKKRKPSKFKRMCYYPYWGVYGRNYQVSDYMKQASPYNDAVIVSFAGTRKDGSIKLTKFKKDVKRGGEANEVEDKKLEEVLESFKKEKGNTDIWLSVGGWTLSQFFSDLAADKEARETFINDCVKIVEKYELKGITLDWEFPGADNPDSDASGRDDDWKNFAILCEKLQKSFDKKFVNSKKEVGIAISMNPTKIKAMCEDKKTVERFKKYVAEIHLMAYDYYGGWDSNVNHQSALYNSDPFNTDNSVKLLLEHFEPSKLILGLGAYGRSWKVSEKKNRGKIGSFGSKDKGGTWEESTYDYWDIENKVKKGTCTKKFDEENGGTFAICGDTVISYDDQQSIAQKTNYAIKNKLGGVMWWEGSGDSRDFDGETTLGGKMKVKANDIPCLMQIASDILTSNSNDSSSKQKETINESKDKNSSSKKNEKLNNEKSTSQENDEDEENDDENDDEGGTESSEHSKTSQMPLKGSVKNDDMTCTFSCVPKKSASS